MPKTVSFKTFGCKQNQYDTDFLKEMFREKGFRVVDAGPSDLVVVNTCLVTSKGAAKCRQAIRAAQRSGAKVVVTGCYPQVAVDEVKDLPGVIVVGGVRGRSRLVELVESALETDRKIVAVEPHDFDADSLFEETPVRSPSLTRAFLKIQQGCDDYCSYCIVPYARGPSRSRPVDNIVDEARELVAKGYKEIVLTGTHIGLYGKEGGERFPHLAQVIHRVAEIAGLLRLRVSSLEPHDVDGELIDCLRLPQVCSHLHLPLQSGSDKVLQMMGRRYDSAFFLDIADKVRRVRPDMAITTDIIVGFPGETDQDFEKTVEVARAVQFTRIHAFKFSARPGTRAHGFSGKVREADKTARVKRVIALGQELAERFHRRYVGKVVEVLAEDDRTKDGLLTGVTGNYIRCRFAGDEELMGRIVPVMIKSANFEGALGEAAW